MTLIPNINPSDFAKAHEELADYTMSAGEAMKLSLAEIELANTLSKQTVVSMIEKAFFVTRDGRKTPLIVQLALAIALKAYTLDTTILKGQDNDHR